MFISLPGIEIAKDSSLLRQKEAYLFHLCGDTELFVPKTRFKVVENYILKQNYSKHDITIHMSATLH